MFMAMAKTFVFKSGDPHFRTSYRVMAIFCFSAKLYFLLDKAAQVHLNNIQNS
jgi:hypothetical protein